MSKLTTAVLILFASIFFIGCQKEVSENPPATAATRGLAGNYKLISVELESVVSMETKDGDDNEKTVSLTHYISKDNKGTVKFDATTIATNNIAYTIDATMKGYIYINGILQDSVTSPLQLSTPPVSSVVPYEVIGTDSIYFSSGSFFVDASASSTPTASKPSGGKFKLEGDKLYITSFINESGIKDVQGYQFNQSTQARSTTILQKQ
ncbi:hypothetical protein QTN47_07890 [Danxiaibacter flavus]|uniref:Lipocalin-like domain-containing protein n=1 Tax=Danxiaibacter flavus TaxID=3049108 RepID=A0ABV3ZD53_9BACT|nr:hypothetical protein QNM32_07890 [Chitinophagaceae bacterium DXS]